MPGGKGEERLGEASCVQLTAVGVCLQRTQLRLGVENRFVITFMCGEE